MPAAGGDKANLAYTPPAEPPQGPPMYSAPQQSPYAQNSYQQQQPPQNYPPQVYSPQPQPQQGYAPHPGPQTHPSQMSAQQVGDQYRAQRYPPADHEIWSIHFLVLLLVAADSRLKGVCGIITAVVCFPIGLICLFIDTEQKCDRCGIKLS
ncbi:hypothetical protein R3P38DRAFT_3198168 [Favolaschia claudopus]|uniref:Brain protein I3 n=1 Tax=Favolaschia claudopus TaxID=2862362 RepID=A0AAW0B5Q7_9AGAR